MRSPVAVIALVLASCGNATPPPATPATPPVPAVKDEPKPEPVVTGAWGAPVESAEQEEEARAFLTALAAGRGHEVSAKAVVIFPGLWSQISDEPDMDSIGIPVTLNMPIGDETMVLAGRAFHSQDLTTAMTSKTFVDIGTRFAAGEIRAATAEERHIAYMSISWEIAGKPLTVAHIDHFTLVMHFDEEDHVVAALDLIEPVQQSITKAP